MDNLAIILINRMENLNQPVPTTNSATHKEPLTFFIEDVQGARAQLKASKCVIKDGGLNCEQRVRLIHNTSKPEILLKVESQDSEANQPTSIVEGDLEIYPSVAVDHSRVYCPLEFGASVPTLTKIYLASVVFIRSASGHILMTQRLPTMSFPDSWVAPGGKVDPQETFLQAAVREIEEEVGLEITAESLQPILFYESTSEIMHEGVEKAKSQIFVMFYMCNLNPTTSPKYGSLAPHEIPVKVQASEVQAFEWVHENSFLNSRCSKITTRRGQGTQLRWDPSELPRSRRS
eukprot:GABU01005140.1.p1 GENE.GABU01005140.1~~GABU01005140.1.p1  ORF type:complete len:290 (-),score=16.09 GABU01005140.1:21-890(-)